MNELFARFEILTMVSMHQVCYNVQKMIANNLEEHTPHNLYCLMVQPLLSPAEKKLGLIISFIWTPFCR